MRVVISLCLIFFMVSCYQPQVQSNPKTNQEKYKYRIDMARAYLEGADYKKAKMEILKAIELRKTPEAYNILGLAYYGLGEYKEAEKAFKKAVELDPDYSTAWNNLSACYIAQKI